MLIIRHATPKHYVNNITYVFPFPINQRLWLHDIYETI